MASQQVSAGAAPTAAPSSMSHSPTITSVPQKSNIPSAAGAWAGPPPRSLLTSSGPSANDARFRSSPAPAPSSPTKYLPSGVPSTLHSNTLSAGSPRASSSKSVASFVANSNSKASFYDYTPSSALAASTGNIGSGTSGGTSSSSGNSTGVSSFSDASIYVPSHQQLSHHLHNSAQLHHHTTTQQQQQHHISRPDPMDEYISASVKRRGALKLQQQQQQQNLAQSQGTATSTNGAPNGTGNGARTSSPSLAPTKSHLQTSPSKSASPSPTSSIAAPNANASNSSLTSFASATSVSLLHASASTPNLQSSQSQQQSPLDTVNWQVLDMSGMSLVVVSPHVSWYGQLSALYLHHNRLASLPVELCTLQQLKFLDLSHNQLAWLPSEIGHLLNLKELILNHNQLQSLPVEVGKLFRLNELMVEENPISNVPLEVLNAGAGAIVAHMRSMLAPTDPPPPRSWLLSAHVDRAGFALPGYFHGLDALLGPKAVRTLAESGHKQVSIQTKDIAKFRIDGSVRTMCYNILADIYAASLNYCPAWALSWNHRKNVVLKEIDLYNPDLLCLQEVVWAQYVQFFAPELEARGYKGAFHPKTRVKFSADANRVDGCASFYRTSMFEEVQAFNIEFQTIAQENSERYCSPDDDSGYLRLTSKDNIAVGLVLRRKDRALIQQRLQQAQQQSGAKSGIGGANSHLNAGGASNASTLVGGNRRNTATNGSSTNQNAAGNAQQQPEDDLLMLVNTHIHWDPDFSDVKLMQVQMLMEQLEAWVEAFSPNLTLPLILGGDFNSMPDSGVYQFLVDGYLAGDHPEFLGYTYGDYTDSGLKHSLQLLSANSTLGSEPAFTNYTGDFNGVLDYIWYSKNSLNVERALNGVDESVVHAYNGALPNPHMPSDHIPLVSDFVQNMNRRG